MRAYRAWTSAEAGGDSQMPPATLSSFRGRRASVVLWNIQTDHRVLSVHAGPYERMRLEARARVRETGLRLEDVLSDIAPAAAGVDDGRRDVLLASAPGAEVAAALTPLVQAGINVRTVLTPPAALHSLARLKHECAPAAAVDGIQAWVAVEERAICMAMLSDGCLIEAHDLHWGFLDELSDFQTERDRYDVAVRLADELGAFLGACQFERPLSQVFVCGAMPELRSMSAQLMDRLDVEVEPLDSLFGIDERRLPETPDVFHEAVSGLRLAWAAAANPRPSLDLYRARHRRAAKAYLSRAAVFAGAAAGLSVGWSIARELPAVAVTAGAPASTAAARASQAEPPVALADRPFAPESTAPIASAAPPLPSRTMVGPSGMLVASMIAPPLGDPLPAPDSIAAPSTGLAIDRPWERVPPLAASARVVPVSTLSRRVTAPPIVPPPPASASSAAPPPAARASAPLDVRQQASEPDTSRPISSVPADAERRTAVTVRPAAGRPAGEPAPAPVRTAREDDAAPFDATLETILSGRDRALAIVNGRIVEVGDEVRGARIVEITPAAVMLRDGQGKLRRLSLGAR